MCNLDIGMLTIANYPNNVVTYVCGIYPDAFILNNWIIFSLFIPYKIWQTNVRKNIITILVITDAIGWPAWILIRSIDSMETEYNIGCQVELTSSSLINQSLINPIQWNRFNQKNLSLRDQCDMFNYVSRSRFAKDVPAI